jgi:hypothetical protein
VGKRKSGGSSLKGCLTAVGYFFLAVVLIIVWQILGTLPEGFGPLGKTIRIKAHTYDGVVLDDATGQPIQAAVVVAALSTRHPANALSGILSLGHYYEPVPLDYSIQYTGASGRYSFPLVDIRRRLNWRVKPVKLELFVYRRGYVGYSNQAIFEGRKSSVKSDLRSDKGKIIRLKPWQEGFDHFEHHSFLNTSVPIENYEEARPVKELFNWEFKMWESQQKWR